MLIETIILATAPNRVFNSESQLEQIAYAAAWWTICPYCQLEHLEAFNKRRRHLVSRYDETISTKNNA